MYFRDIWTVAKKELKAGFSDKVVLFQIVLMPFLIVFGYAMLMVVMGEAQSTAESEEAVNAYYVNAPEYMVEGLQELELKSTDVDKIESLKKDIADKKCALVVVFPEDFTLADGTSTDLSNIDIWYNSTNAKSYQMYSAVNMLLNAYQPKLFSINESAEPAYDLGDEDALLRDMLAGLMPIMLLMGVFMVCMNLAAESVAGDKERGFLNTMLIAPVKRSSIAGGKAVYILITAIIGGLSAFIGMAVSLPRLAEAMELESGFSYNVQEYLLLFAITITAVFALASILLIISTLAKDVKQATNVAPAVMMVLMIGGMLATTEGFKPMIEDLGMINNLIPAWNSMLLMGDIIQLEYSVSSALISSGVNLLFSVISIWIVGRCFESEKIVNG
ncbi:MAG: ABC transporter permease [Lachnospiraceae bacterium]|nr:ABC transporter permease [Lachnospiraceae bacterium]